MYNTDVALRAEETHRELIVIQGRVLFLLPLLPHSLEFQSFYKEGNTSAQCPKSF